MSRLERYGSHWFINSRFWRNSFRAIVERKRIDSRTESPGREEQHRRAVKRVDERAHNRFLSPCISVQQITAGQIKRKSAEIAVARCGRPTGVGVSFVPRTEIFRPAARTAMLACKTGERESQLRILLGRSPGSRVWWPRSRRRLGLFPSCASCAGAPAHSLPC